MQRSRTEKTDTQRMYYSECFEYGFLSLSLSILFLLYLSYALVIVRVLKIIIYDFYQEIYP